MLATHDVTLQPATVADAAVLSSLLELYIHDMSEIFTPGHWIVRVSEAHAPGLLFWKRVIEEYTHGACSRTAHHGKQHAFRVFSFRSDAPSATVSALR